MKSKILVFIVALALVVSCFTVCASAEGGEYLLEFDKNEDFIGTVNANALELSRGDNALDLTITGEVHPLIWMALGVDTGKSATPLDANEYKFMKIRYNSGCEDDILRFFWGVYTDVNAHPGPNFADYLILDFEIEHQAGWKSVIVNLPELVGDLWSNYISAIRFDIDPFSDSVNLTSESEGLIFSIDYIAFFKTAEEAEAFRADADDVKDTTASQDTVPDQTEDSTAEATASEEQTTEAPVTDEPTTKENTTGEADGTTEAKTGDVTEDSDNEGKEGLSSETIAIIIVAAAVVIALIGAIIIIKKSKKK